MEEILVPDIGEFRDVEVIEVLVNSGDYVRKEDSIITLESDKASMEVPTPLSGVVEEIFLKIGDKVSEGDGIMSVIPATQRDSSTTEVGQTEEKNLGDRALEANLRDSENPLEARIRLVEQKLTVAETHILGKNQPAIFLGPLASSVKINQCFLVMPYSEDWSSGVESIVDSSCKDAGYQLIVAKSMDGRFVPHDIWQGITGSGVIVADLTGANPNVAYEVGLADALGREIILISQTTGVPFDFSGQRLLLYENTLSGASVLQQSLVERLRDVRDREKPYP